MDLQLRDTLAFPLDILEYEIWNPWTEIVYHAHLYSMLENHANVPKNHCQ